MLFLFPKLLSFVHITKQLSGTAILLSKPNDKYNAAPENSSLSEDSMPTASAFEYRMLSLTISMTQ